MRNGTLLTWIWTRSVTDFTENVTVNDKDDNDSCNTSRSNNNCNTSCSDNGACPVTFRPPWWPSGKGAYLESGRPVVQFLLALGFLRVESWQWLKIGTPVATLPGAWHYRVRAGIGWPGVSILWLGEIESLICSLCLSVSACKIVWAHPSLRYATMLLGC